jgi:RNA polymerase-binding protein DksA
MLMNLNHYKELLLKQKGNLENTINSMKENRNREQGKYFTSELSNYDNHPAELGSELYETEHSMALKAHEEYLLKEVEDALKNIESGTYGKCANCDEYIAEKRLEVIPYAKLCINCEESKQEPQTQLDPLAPKSHISWVNNKHGGMEQFNDLMKYGSADSPQDLGGYYGVWNYYNNDADEQIDSNIIDRVSNDDYKKQLP